MRIAVAGATGVLGRAVVPRLIERGHTVHAMVRGESVSRLAAKPNLVFIRADILAPDTLAPLVSGCQVVLHLATAIPRPGGARDWAANDRVRREGTRNLIESYQAAGGGRYVQQSVAMLHAGGGDAASDEDAPLKASPVLQSALEMEEMVRGSGLRWIILRGGLFYGPGTDRMRDWNDAARSGRLRIPGDGSDYVSLVHVEDMARAVVIAAESSSAHAAFNIVDDRPVTYRELFGHLAVLNGAKSPETGGAPLLESFRVSNARARSVLGWAPRYPDYLSGWTL